MPRVQRSADVVWDGNVARGHGTIEGGSGGLRHIEISLPTRFGDADGHTSPEELIAAALAGCFSMALSAGLSKADTPPERLETHAVVTLDEVDGANRITTIDLSVVGHVPGVDDETFQQAARTAEQGCPVSNVLNAEIRLDARLAS
ncbi:MAG: lipoyl-dependent peroxiredoxin [Gaiellaceae bacterium]|jgi:osmotically inducible protein OsmC|nr:lipoyl-dependent peroxiredoxin [Gaiellaceae bacterium]MDX6478382.1 lipoyl-dependent peroxiredoxin [Gaiellaceae bacterium]MDX6482807.1 lipoyl-dependent peroxiredoxin [Gaiellaceae bacterium]MDX6487566.1 lipoyl-dependent peroxiredoxin [Gaiellaceae bacterium]MDX6509162.1 lipoyl-dependent peroxiredoxin [Gaiellaceae bacterium]